MQKATASVAFAFPETAFEPTAS